MLGSLNYHVCNTIVDDNQVSYKWPMGVLREHSPLKILILSPLESSISPPLIP